MRRQNQAEHVVRAVSRSAQRVTEESAGTAEAAVAATVLGARRATETAGRQMELLFRVFRGSRRSMRKRASVRPRACARSWLCRMSRRTPLRRRNVPGQTCTRKA
jgi:hypothetical protein